MKEESLFFLSIQLIFEDQKDKYMRHWRKYIALFLWSVVPLASISTLILNRDDSTLPEKDACHTDDSTVSNSPEEMYAQLSIFIVTSVFAHTSYMFSTKSTIHKSLPLGMVHVKLMVKHPLTRQKKQICGLMGKFHVDLDNKHVYIINLELILNYRFLEIICIRMWISHMPKFKPSFRLFHTAQFFMGIHNTLVESHNLFVLQILKWCRFVAFFDINVWSNVYAKTVTN